jgi:hypothetical protein
VEEVEGSEGVIVVLADARVGGGCDVLRDDAN